jgi:hypothetical protein
MPEKNAVVRQPYVVIDQAITGTNTPPRARPKERLESARARQRLNQWMRATLMGKKLQNDYPIAITMNAP